MLKIDLLFKIMNQIDYYLKEKIKKVTELMKDKSGGKIMIKLPGL